MDLAGVSLDSVERIAVLRPAPMIVVTPVGVTMVPVCVTLSMLEQIAKSIKKMCMFQSSVLLTVCTGVLESALMSTPMMVWVHHVNAMCNVPVNASQPVLDLMTTTVPYPKVLMQIPNPFNHTR